MTITAATFHPAGLAKRLAAALVDLACLSAITFVSLSWTYGRQYFDLEYLRLLPNYHDFLFWLGAVPSIALLLSWLLWKTTLGKALFHLAIVDHTSGGQPSNTAFIKRLVGYYLCIASMGLGFLFALFSKTRQGLQDKVAQTLVVDPNVTSAEPMRSKGNSDWLPILAAITNLAIAIIIFYSPIGQGNGNGVIGYSIYRGLLLVLLHLPLAAVGIFTAVTIGLATNFGRAAPGILLNIGALAGVLTIQYLAQ